MKFLLVYPSYFTAKTIDIEVFAWNKVTRLGFVLLYTSQRVLMQIYVWELNPEPLARFWVNFLGWIIHSHLQMLLFFGEIQPAVDPGRGKVYRRGTPSLTDFFLECFTSHTLYCMNAFYKNSSLVLCWCSLVRMDLIVQNLVSCMYSKETHCTFTDGTQLHDMGPF